MPHRSDSPCPLHL